MHIAFQRSGVRPGVARTGGRGGRGEYEVVGSHSGYTAISLEGWTFNLAWPDGIVRETGLSLEPAGSGKPRLRSLIDPPFQIGRMIAAMCMLPDPRREYGGTTADLPVITRKGYVLSRLGFGPGTEFTPVVDMVTIEPAFIDLEDAVSTVSIGIESRWKRVTRIYDAARALPTPLANAIEAHRAYMATGGMVGPQLSTITNQIEKALAGTDSRYVAGQDSVEFLEILVGLFAPDGPSLPTPDKLGEDEPEVSARSAHEYRLARMRGPSARAFAKAVHKAYKHRCAFCGGVYGGVPGVLTGIDAAHILAWTKYDLDVVANGLSLCKLHHWAFDAALVMPVAVKDGGYVLKFTTLAGQLAESTRKQLLPTDGMTIPTDWLPTNPAERPSRNYLERLYADLAVIFQS